MPSSVTGYPLNPLHWNRFARDPKASATLRDSQLGEHTEVNLLDPEEARAPPMARKNYSDEFKAPVDRQPD
jgi:hypothetical protein